MRHLVVYSGVDKKMRRGAVRYEPTPAVAKKRTRMRACQGIKKQTRG